MRTNLNADEPSDRTGAVRRGLVLEGGGSKGAYALGWLRAFRQHGVRFDAVAGTSVGALNAVLWSTGKIDEGKTIWRNIKPARVYPLRRPAVFFFPIFLIHAVCRITAFRLRGTGWGEHIVAFSKRFMIFLPIVVVATVLTFLFANVGDWFSGREIPDDGMSELVLMYLYMFFYPLSPFFPLTFSLTLVLIPFCLELMGVSLLRTKPLYDQVADVLDSATLAIPTYVTVAREKYVWDPKAIVRGWDIDQRMWLPRRRYVPEYRRLCDESSSSRATLVLASASLPFGIVPGVRVNGMTCVDGGMADNLPLFPLVTRERCDEIVVIHLRPKEDISVGPHSDEYLAYCKSIDYQLFVADLEERDALTGGTCPEPKPIPKRPELAFWPQKIITVAPSRRLGGFLTGTMNFFGRYTRQIEQQGFDDAMQQSSQFWNQFTSSAKQATRSEINAV